MKKRRKESAKELPPVRNVVLWSGVFFSLGVALTLAAQFFIFSRGQSTPSDSVPSSRAADDPIGLVQTGKKGPWGVLEYNRILLRNYNALSLEGSPHLKPTRWLFTNAGPAQLRELLLNCQLGDAARNFLLDTNHWEMLPNGVAISPPDEIVLGLGAEARGRLYALLKANPDNFPQANAFQFPNGSFNEFFANIGLSREHLALLRDQIFQNDGFSFVCIDRPLQSALGTNEFELLLRAFGTVRTWRVALRISPDSDIDALVKYWGAGGRERTIRPLLQSLAREPNGQTINIAFLLPTFARMQIYTYPDPISDPSSLREECFYSALNFFSETPNPDLVDGQKATQFLLTNYAPTEDKMAFGDLLVLMNTDNVAVHVCVYVADDFVFTKDGSGTFRPWVLMKLRDMMADYTTTKPVYLGHMRRKTNLTSLSPSAAGKAIPPPN